MRRQVAHPLRLSLIAAAGFAVVTLAYRSGVLRQADAEFAAWLHNIKSEALYAAAMVDDRVFDPTPAFIVAVSLALFLLWRGEPWAWLAPAGFGLSAAIDFGLKVGFSVFLHPRQLISAAQILIGSHFHGLAPYPSGHVERATFLAVVALAYLPRWIAAPMVGLAVFTAFARVYIDAHRLSEVLGGIELGTLIAAVAIWAAAVAPSIAARARRLRGGDARRSARSEANVA